MTRDDSLFITLIEQRVVAITDLVWDHESAHLTEDALHAAALRYIAEHAGEPWATIAAKALTTLDIEFHRWCA